MKCFSCGKPVSGQYVVAERFAFHPECFVCAKCKRMITGSYQIHRGKYYHPGCYQEKRGLVCSKCGEVLGNSWIEHEGKKYHSHCLQIRCDICGKEIDGEYKYDSAGRYHKWCYLNHKAPRCSVCDQPIVGKYLVDEWGNRSHPEHDNQKIVSCDYCSRIISFSTSNGGNHYSDGRVVCGICKLTAIDSEHQVRHSQERVLHLLAAAPAGFGDIPAGIPVQLVDRHMLKKLRDSSIPEKSQGLTRSHIVTQGKKRIKAEYRISILYGMPKLEFEATLAHELLHVWLIERDIKLSEKEMEGFCDLGSALVYEADNSMLAKILLKRMEERTDRVYGKGYRKMNRKLQQMGWKEFKKMISSR